MADGAVTRRGLCAGALAAAAGSAVAVPVLVEAQGPADDRRVLELILLIERTEAAFYGAALDAGILDGELAEFAEVVRGHEAEHLGAVTAALGDDLPAEPTFDFGEHLADAGAFARAAARLEDTAVGAYNGQAGNVSPKVFSPWRLAQSTAFRTLGLLPEPLMAIRSASLSTKFLSCSTKMRS